MHIIGNGKTSGSSSLGVSSFIFIFYHIAAEFFMTLTKELKFMYYTLGFELAKELWFESGFNVGMTEFTNL